MPSMIMPAMSDARALTSWRSNCDEEARLRNEFGLRSEAEYRMALQTNAKAFAQKTKIDLAKPPSCPPFFASK